MSRQAQSYIFYPIYMYIELSMLILLLYYLYMYVLISLRYFLGIFLDVMPVNIKRSAPNSQIQRFLCISTKWT